MWNKGKIFLFQRIFLSLIAVCCLLPMLFLVWQALRQDGSFSLRQFENILLYDRRFYIWMWNSVGYTAAILALHLPVSVLAGYGFSQYDFPGKKGLFFLYILLMLLPFQATVVPQYLTLRALQLLDTRWAVILPNAFGAFGTFLMTQFMRQIDPAILQAAQMEGVGRMGLLWYIMLPLCRPAIAALTVLQLLSSWSLIDQPLLFLRREQLLPLSLELSSRTFGENAFAAGVLFAIPPVMACLFCRDALEQGISLGNLK